MRVTDQHKWNRAKRHGVGLLAMISWLSAIACVGGLEGTDEANSYSGAILFCVASFLLINQMERMKKGEQR